MKKARRIIIAISVIISCISSSLAVGVPFKGSTTNDGVQRKLAEIMAVVTPQLAEQNSLDLLPVYESIYREQLEAAATRDRGIMLLDDIEARHAPYGGVLTYVNGTKQIGVTYMNEDKTFDYILDSIALGKSFVVGEVLKNLLGWIPVVGGLTSIVFTAQTLVSAQAATDIKANGRCTQITNTIQGSGRPTSSVTGWATRYYIYPPANGTSIDFTIFSS